MTTATPGSTSLLFTPIRIRDLTLRNRLVIAPMATYSAEEGKVTDWHLVHLGGLAKGGAGLVFMEATAVRPEGRITHGCTGIWSDDQVPGMRRICDFIRTTGAKSAIQLAHGGRKASMQRPWHGNGPMTQADFDRGDATWDIVGPTDDPAGPGWLEPRALTVADLEQLKLSYRAATERALKAGFDVVEVHGAHGYLLHSFLSPLANKRTDGYGGDRAGRMRFPLEVAEVVRAAWPSDRPLFFRISAVDGINIGWGIEDSVAFAAELKARGVDVVDCSTGGMILPREAALVSRVPGFQVPFAEAVRREAGVMSMAVGLIREPAHAEAILREGKADLVAIAREALYNPHWPAQAALALGADADWTLWPEAYGWWLKRRDKQQAVRAA